MPLLGGAAWLGAVAGTLARGGVLVALAGVAAMVAISVLWLARCRGLPGVAAMVAGLLLVVGAAGAVAALRAERVAHNPVAVLADEGAAVTVVGTVTSDPRTVAGPAGR